MAKTVAIVGGGITGLSAAYFLKQNSKAPVKIILIDQGEKLGGKIQTEWHDGFLVETGPESFVSYKPAGIQLCKTLGIEDQLLEPKIENRKTFIYFGGKLVELPEGILSIFTQSPIQLAKTFLKTPLLSWSGKFRMGFEPFMRKGDPDSDESVESFFERRVGKEFFHHLLDPLLSSVYGGRSGSLSMKCLLKQFYEEEKTHGSLFRAVLARGSSKNNAAGGTKRSIFITLRKGLGHLVQTLASFVADCRISLQTRVMEAHKKANGFEIILCGQNEILFADALLLTIPAFAASGLVKDFDPGLATLLSTFPYASSTVVTFGFDKNDLGHDLKGYGFIAPAREGLFVSACTWSSSKWDARAPDEKALMRCYVGSSEKDPDLIRKKALESLTPILDIHGKPILSLVHQHSQSMPQYVVGHEEKWEKVKSLLGKHPGLFLAGSAYEGVGIPDCVQSGKSASENVLAYLEKGLTGKTEVLHD